MWVGVCPIGSDERRGGRQDVGEGCEGVSDGCEGASDGCEGVSEGCEGVSKGLAWSTGIFGRRDGVDGGTG